MKKLILLFLLTLPIKIFSQGPPPPGLPDDDPPTVPINQMEGVLLLAGVAYGLYTVNKKK